MTASSGREDAGLFTADHRDERYLPFELMGAISDWNLKLTSPVPTFDWRTISDVVLDVRYTARDGGDLLRSSRSPPRSPAFRSAAPSLRGATSPANGTLSCIRLKAWMLC